MLSSTAQARGHGKCDGFHACRCGVTAARKNGLPLAFNGHNLKRAVEWTRAFARTSLRPGVVGYVRRGGPSGHVFSVVAVHGDHMATVYDDRGTYERNVSNAIFVDPTDANGNPMNRRHAAIDDVAARPPYPI